ncbi:phenylalanine--tRNA ligase subunit alpha, partial [Microgenomates group bacterium]|nr:phenylalanine--tRNA ligase subunit alpha [Microgenomates group bacterium]
MQSKLLNLKNQALALINQAEDLKELKRLRLNYFGRQGQINQLLKDIPKLDPEQKKKIGRLA